VFRTTPPVAGSVRAASGGGSLHPAVADNTHVQPDELGRVYHGCLYKTKRVIKLQKNFERIISLKL
jgi:hypothetical protein